LNNQATKQRRQGRCLRRDAEGCDRYCRDPHVAGSHDHQHGRRRRIPALQEAGARSFFPRKLKLELQTMQVVDLPFIFNESSEFWQTGIRKIMILRWLHLEIFMSLQVVGFSPVANIFHLFSRFFMVFFSRKGVDFSSVTQNTPIFLNCVRTGLKTGQHNFQDARLGYGINGIDLGGGFEAKMGRTTGTRLR
jgi:hypothetical protein